MNIARVHPLPRDGRALASHPTRGSLPAAGPAPAAGGEFFKWCELSASKGWLHIGSALALTFAGRGALRIKPREIHWTRQVLERERRRAEAIGHPFVQIRGLLGEAELTCEASEALERDLGTLLRRGLER